MRRLQISLSFRRDDVLVCEPRRKPVSLASLRLVGSENDDSLLFGDGADASKLRRWRCAAPSPCSGDGVWRCLDGAAHDTALADMAGATVSTLRKIRCVVVVMCGGRQGEFRAACGHGTRDYGLHGGGLQGGLCNLDSTAEVLMSRLIAGTVTPEVLVRNLGADSK